MTQLDALELELRRLPNVAFVEFLDRPDGLVVQLAAFGAPDLGPVRRAAEAACRARLDQPFTVELAGGPPRDRIRILAVRRSQTPRHDVDDLEVHLALHGARTIGRARSGDAHAAASATFEALERLGAKVPFRVQAAAQFDHTRGEGVMLVLGSPTAGERYGVAAADTVELAAVRATMHALNRYLSSQPLPALAG